MIADLKPYAEYKASSQAWLGEVPQHWSVVPNRAVFAEVKDRDHPDEEMLSVTITRGIVRQKALLTGSSKKDSSNLDKSAYKLVQPRDIAYNKMRAWQGAIGASALRGIISPAYVVMRLRNDDDLPSYYHHLYRTPQFAKEAERWSYGITSDMWSLRPEHFKMIYTPEPPPDEQAAIVRFLDWANGRLERAIRAKRKVIALLNEQRQAIIHRAVTRGLDPSVPLKPSGIPWLAEIPEHWGCRKLSTICSLIVDGTHFSPVHDTTGEYLYITAKNIKEHGVDISSATYVSASAHRQIYQRCPVRKGDVLYIKDGATAGLATVNNLADEFSMLSSVALLRPLPSTATADFLALALNDSVFKQHALSRVVGGAMTRFTVALLKRFSIVLPPLGEQERIVSAVAEEVRPLRAAQTKLEREVALLREYRTRLVADVVTGKLDVREAGARVPHEAPLVVIEDDADLGDESEAADEEAAV